MTVYASQQKDKYEIIQYLATDGLNTPEALLLSYYFIILAHQIQTNIITNAQSFNFVCLQVQKLVYIEQKI